jgi:hypothetical protein
MVESPFGSLVSVFVSIFVLSLPWLSTLVSFLMVVFESLQPASNRLNTAAKIQVIRFIFSYLSDEKMILMIQTGPSIGSGSTPRDKASEHAQFVSLE